MSKQLQTRLQHALALPTIQRERGVRHWSAVQLLSPTWFFVESYHGAHEGRQRWITPSILEAAEIRSGLIPAEWVRIFLFMDTGNSVDHTPLFEEIEEAYELCISGEQMLRLANDKYFVIGAASRRLASTEPKEMRLLYRRQTACKVSPAIVEQRDDELNRGDFSTSVLLDTDRQ